ncbi:hypothetical protein QAD02_000838 [Eretmocerus hayati]|uniref:Uncharacterized protein n=1 Tax=Eretmocerus hayati TaxID=131215 RepID=A0ACC2NEB7_9HYME|nr:hypothetical protein QAD02_000838 [Eretmocerus hayati]
MTFPNLDAPLKTDQNFRSSLPYSFNTKQSPLELIGVLLNSEVPLEIMHQGHLGVTKRMINHWSIMFGGGVGALEIVNLFSESYKALAKCVPLEFARKPRGLDELCYWKATEFRLFLLYFGVVAIRKFLSHDYIVHFDALNCAMRILSDPDYHLTLNAQADMLLKYFVKNVEVLYGREHTVLCMHSAIHLAADVRKIGPLDNYSSYLYESFLGYLKSLIKSSSSPLSQVVKRLIEKILVGHETTAKEFEISLTDLKSRSDQTKLPPGFTRAHASLNSPNFKLKDTYPNNFCYLADGTIVSIDHICYQNNRPVILGHAFPNLANLPDHPCDSSTLGMYQVKDLSDELQVWSIDLIKKKGFQIPVEDSHYMFSIMHSSIN